MRSLRSFVIVLSLLAPFCDASEQPKTFPSLPAVAQSRIREALARANPNSAPVSQLIELTPPDGTIEGYFGESVAISGDTVAVESISNENGKGAIYVFVKPASGWQDVTLTAELTSTGLPSAMLFPPVVISPDGNTIAVNSTTESPEHGYQVLLYEKPTGGWSNMTQSAALYAAGGGNAFFGNAIGMDNDDVLVGATGCSGNGDFSAGQAYLFVKPATGWTNMTQTANLKETQPLGCDDYGASVAISGDTAVVGRTGAGMTPPVSPGSLYVFTKPATGWTTMTETAELTTTVHALNNGIGASVSFSDDTILAGARNIQGAPHSAAYIYTEPAGGWVNMTQTATLTNTNSGVTSIGWSVALDGPTAAVIAQYRDKNENAVTLYYEPANGWQNASLPDVTFFASAQGAFDGFGYYALALSDDTIVVGADFATIGGISEEGSAYIFGQN